MAGSVSILVVILFAVKIVLAQEGTDDGGAGINLDQVPGGQDIDYGAEQDATGRRVVKFSLLT
jgi:hypothetical protein